MFDDGKCYLFLMNAYDIDGNLLDFNLSFPISKKDLIIPSSIKTFNVIEYHRFKNKSTSGNVIFNVYVGKVCLFKCFNDNKIKYYKAIDMDISDNDLVCYDDNNVIFAKIDYNDIVVNDIKELRKVIFTISNEYGKIKKSTDKIRSLSIGR